MNIQQPPTAAAPPALPQWENEANQLGLQGEHRRLYKLLRDFHGFTREQCVTLRNQGYMTLPDLVDWEYKDVRSLLENLSNRPTSRGGREFGDRRIKQLQALAWFVTDRDRRGLTYDMNLYQAELNTYIKFAKIDAQIGKDDAADKPEKFKYADWNKWEESVHIYLNSIITKAGIPLSYVIRKDLEDDADWESLDRKVQQIQTAPLEGLLFDLDSEKVLTLLKELCLKTEAEPWIRNIKCGREAMQALQRHYDGVDEGKRRVEEARARISSVFYKHEATFSFEKFATTLYDSFQILDKYNKPLYEDEKLRLLFSKCQNNHPDFKQEINICRQQYDTFAEAVTYMKIVVARLFLDTAKPKAHRNVSSINTKEINGVDITDMRRWYESSEIKKLNESQAGRRVLSKIMGDKRRHDRHKEKINKLRSNKKRRVKAVETSKPEGNGSVLSEQNKSLVAAVITGMNNSTRQNQPMNGRVIRTGRNSVSTDSAVTYDHLGNPL